MKLYSYICFFLLLNISVQAQQYKNLIFEGAGMRGIAYVGALSELEKQGVLSGIKKVGGTSAGALTALTVSLGYTPEEIENIIYNTNFAKFNDGKFFFIGGIHRTTKKFGWYHGDQLTRWLGKIIEDKTGNPDITFKELKEKGFKDLYITGTSLNQQRMIVFSHENYPDMKVKDAVRISVSIPLYYRPVYINSRGEVVKKCKNTDTLDMMVDGGITANFPIYIFDSIVTIQGKTIRYANKETIGLRIDRENQIEYDCNGNRCLAPIPIHNFKDYMSAFYNYTMENLNRHTLIEDDWARTISISSSNLSSKVRKMKKEEKDLLINNGIVAAKRFLK